MKTRNELNICMCVCMYACSACACGHAGVALCVCTYACMCVCTCRLMLCACMGNVREPGNVLKPYYGRNRLALFLSWSAFIADLLFDENALPMATDKGICVCKPDVVSKIRMSAITRVTTA